MINFKNYLNGIFLTLIFFVLLSLKNLTVFADQKNKLEKNPTSCEIQENKIICFNIKINNNFQVNLLNDPYRILMNFKNLAILLLLPVCFILEHGKSQKQEEILLSSMLEDGIVTAE